MKPRCKKGKHYYKTNKRGITWCKECGHLASYDVNSNKKKVR